MPELRLNPPTRLFVLTTNIHLRMTKRLECPIEGCTATIEAETEDEVMSQAEAHATSSHPEVELDDDTIQTIKSGIEDV